LARWFGPARQWRPSTDADALSGFGFGRELLFRLRENEQVWTGFRDLEIRLLSAATLQDVFNTITDCLVDRFSSITDVSICWLDADYELSRLLNKLDPVAARRFIGLSAGRNPEWLPRERPWLGRLDNAMRDRLFQNARRPVNSAAIVPLRLRGEWVGTLNQGSADPNHYSPEMATDLLEHLALVFALCVENSLNRIRLQHDGLTDPLTGVANRRLFARRLNEEVSVWRRKGGHLTCLIADIDHFKDINDRHGHPFGDEVLKKVAAVLSSGLRTSDVLARQGGEEFALLLPGTNPERGVEIADRLRQEVARLALMASGTAEVAVTVSIGVAALGPGQVDRVEDPAAWIIQQADDQLYLAKAQGRNRVVHEKSAEPLSRS